MSQTTLKQGDFVRAFMDSGFRYADALKIYHTFMQILEEAVVQARRVELDPIGALVPSLRPSRPVTMGFRRNKNGQVTRQKTQYLIGKRVAWQFRVYKSFKNSRDLGEWLRVS